MKPANLEREGLVFRELNEENWSGVVAGESSCLSEESTRIEGADQVTHTLSLHTHFWSENIVSHLVQRGASQARERERFC